MSMPGLPRPYVRYNCASKRSARECLLCVRLIETPRDSLGRAAHAKRAMFGQEGDAQSIGTVGVRVATQGWPLSAADGPSETHLGPAKKTWVEAMRGQGSTAMACATAV